jgi:UDP-sugar pyrophosphorylase
VFRIPQYVERLKATGGIVPEFVNPKYANAERTIFKSPTRLECMMQDYPKLINENGRVGFTTYPTWYCFSPVKNNINDALTCFKKGLPSFGAA